MSDIAKEVLKIKRKVANKKLTQTELQRIDRDANDLINALVEYTQRKDLVSAEKGIVQILYNNKKGEIVLTDSGIFLISENEIKKLSNKELINSSKKELEEALGKTHNKLQTKLSSEVLSILKKELGEFELVF